MGVDDEVWHDAVLCPRHVFLGVGDSNGALLPMPTGKLVTHLWYPDGPHLSTQQTCHGQLSSAEMCYFQGSSICSANGVCSAIGVQQQQHAL